MNEFGLAIERHEIYHAGVVVPLIDGTPLTEWIDIFETVEDMEPAGESDQSDEVGVERAAQALVVAAGAEPTVEADRGQDVAPAHRRRRSVPRHRGTDRQTISAEDDSAAGDPRADDVVHQELAGQLVAPRADLGPQVAVVHVEA